MWFTKEEYFGRDSFKPFYGIGGLIIICYGGWVFVFSNSWGELWACLFLSPVIILIAVRDRKKVRLNKLEHFKNRNLLKILVGLYILLLIGVFIALIIWIWVKLNLLNFLLMVGHLVLAFGNEVIWHLKFLNEQRILEKAQKNDHEVEKAISRLLDEYQHLVEFLPVHHNSILKSFLREDPDSWFELPADIQCLHLKSLLNKKIFQNQ